MALFEIPLRNYAQKFSISLAGTIYHMRVSWCPPASCWVLDIADVNDNPIVQGIPMITGADLLEQYGYLGFPGKLIATTDFDLTKVPTYENLGDTSHLFFQTAD